MPNINHYYVTKQEVDAQMHSDAASIHAHPRAKAAHAAVVATFKAAGLPETKNFINRAYLRKPVTLLHPIHHEKHTADNYSVFPVVKERVLTEKSSNLVEMPSKRVPTFLRSQNNKPVNVTVEKVTPPVYTLVSHAARPIDEKWFVEERLTQDSSEGCSNVDIYGPFDSEGAAMASILCRVKQGYDIPDDVQVFKRPVDSTGRLAGTGVTFREATPAMTTLRVAELAYPREEDIQGYFVVIYDYS